MEIQVFDNQEFGSIQIIMIDDEPWFVGKEIATVLGYKNTKDAVARHVEEEDKKVLTHTEIQRSGITTFQSPRGLTVIDESGLYSLILGSELESARRFKRWVTKEVLPSIRKTGSYGKPVSTLSALEQTVAVLREHEERLKEIERAQDTIGERLTKIESKVEKKPYPYPDKKRRDKIRKFVYAFCKNNQNRVLGEDGTPYGIGELIGFVNEYLIDSFKNSGIDLSSELEDAKQQYQSRYEMEKLNGTPNPTVLRPSKIRELSIQSLLSTTVELTTKAINLLNELQKRIEVEY